MTSKEVKQAHDEIWAVRKKIKGFRAINLRVRPEICITVYTDYGFTVYKDLAQVRRFLDGLE